MPLGFYMLNSVIRIVGDKRDRTTDRFRREPLGSGFLVQVQHEERPETWISYVVTAHHVIDGQPNPELVFPDPAVPGAPYPPVSTSCPDWRQPIDGLDVAVLPSVSPHGYD
jgi:hypothetical protein